MHDEVDKHSQEHASALIVHLQNAVLLPVSHQKKKSLNPPILVSLPWIVQKIAPKPPTQLQT